jgi:excisionase family DNA binding protein
MQTSRRSAGPEATRSPAFSREELLTVDEVADVLRVKKKTAADYMRRGVIPAFKLGRFWYSLRPRLNAHLEGAESPYRRPQ